MIEPECLFRLEGLPDARQAFFLSNNALMPHVCPISPGD